MFSLILMVIAVYSSVGGGWGHLVVRPLEVIIDKETEAVMACGNMTYDGKFRRPQCKHMWTKDGALLPEDGHKYNMDDEPGHLLISDLTSDDNGVYRCMCIGCDIGLIFSNNVTLWIKPNASSTPHQSLVIGYNGSLHCQVSRATTAIIWTKDHLWEIASWNYTKIDGPFYDHDTTAHPNGTLAIRRVKVSDDGVYKCTVLNKAGNSSSEFVVSVEWPSDIYQPEGNCTKDVMTSEREESVEIDTIRKKELGFDGDRLWSDEEKSRRGHHPVFVAAPPTCVRGWSGSRDFEIPCHAVGYPIPTVYWTKEDGNGFDPEEVKLSLVAITVGVLRIDNLSPYHEGTYICGAYNEHGHSFYHVKIQVDVLDKICGVLHESVRSKRITGGDEVPSIAHWPWQVLITYNPVIWPFPNSFCGGSIVDVDKVVTAWHCTVFDVYSRRLIKSEDIIITVGANNRNNVNDPPAQVVGVKSFYKLNPDNVDKDLAILILNVSLTFSKHIRPICLPASSEVVPPPDTQCVVSGYGLHYPGGPSDTAMLRSAAVLIADWNDCKRAYDFLPRYGICAGYNNGERAACPNDSGGPLACIRPSTGQWMLVGVLSGGSACGTPYNYYANVVQHSDWIKNPNRPLNQFDWEFREVLFSKNFQ